MIRRLATRLAQMDAAEVEWRLKTASRSLGMRAAVAIRPPRWSRTALSGALAPLPTLATAKHALAGRDWKTAHEALSQHFIDRPSRFPIHPRDRQALAVLITTHEPDARNAARSRADRILEGRYDLLGYRGLAFTANGAAEGSMPDWHLDPVHGRRAPERFWSTVPYLDPSCGDHKIIWELNRHQHWLALGRGYWLTDDARYRARFISELASWQAANPPLVGVNWSSMLELAFRTISWLWALQFFADSDANDDSPWTVDLLTGLHRQLTHVEQNLSHYFSPNTHLLGEALALYVAGRSLPELAASERWSTIGRRILVAQAARQVDADGGHCERSTHYHRYTLDFYLLALQVARTTRDPIAAAFERTVARLASAARLLADDFGRAPHLGDDDGGMLLPIAGRDADDWRDSLGVAATLTGDSSLRIGATTEEELWMTHMPATLPAPQPRRSGALPGTGYFVSRTASELHVVIDGGPHGFRNAGHAHADALSIAASHRGQPLLIDPGTACYTIDAALRDRFRSTQAHNTLTIDGRWQSAPAGPFHWSRPADATTHRWRTTAGFDYFDGSHDGYAPFVHRRRVFIVHGELLVVADYVQGAKPFTAAVQWHIAPQWTVDVRHRGAAIVMGSHRVGLTIPEGRIEQYAGDAASGLGWHSPVYGRVEPATTLRISRQAAAPLWMVSVFDFASENPVQQVESVPVWAEAGSLAHASAIRIDRDGVSDHLLFVEPADNAARATWRVGEFETDARVLFARVASGAVTDLGIVDGSTVRSSARRSIGIALGRIAPALFIDQSSIRTFTTCAASPAS